MAGSKMKQRQFLKQNLMKSLVLTLILLIISTLITFVIPLGLRTYGIPFLRSGDTTSGYFPQKGYVGIGFPVSFYAYDPGEWPGNVKFPPLYNYFNFIITLLFWYIVSSLIIFFYNKSKLKNKKRKKWKRLFQLI